MNTTEFTFDKTDTKLIKGVAIICMFYHHFFGFPSWRAADCQFIPTYIGNMCIESLIASFGRICVGIFVFVSGYALFLKSEKRNGFWNITKNATRFLAKYWIIFLLFLLFGVVFGEPLPPFDRLIQQCFGIATGCDTIYLDYIHPAFAWYVSFYLMYIYISPLLTKLCKWGFIENAFIITIVLFGSDYLLNCIAYEIVPTTVNNLITNFVIWGYIGMIGYLFAKHNIFVLVHNWLHRCFNKYIVLLLAIIVIPAMVIAWNYLGFSIVYKIPFLALYTPIFIYAILYIFRFSKCSFLKRILVTISDEGTNMWFLHSIFFTPLRTVQWIAYLPKYPLLILAWTLFLMYICSKFITRLTNMLVKAIKENQYIQFKKEIAKL